MKSRKKGTEHKNIGGGGICKGLRWEDLGSFQDLKEGHCGWEVKMGQSGFR